MNLAFQSLKINLLNVGFSSLDKTWNYDNVVSPFWRLYYIRSGSGVVFHHNMTFQLKPRHLYLVPAYTFSRYQCSSSMEQYYLHFTEELSEGRSIFGQSGFVFEVKAAKNDRILIERLLELNPGRHLEKEDPKDYDNHQTLKRFEAFNNRIPAGDYVETNAIIMILLSRFMKHEHPTYEAPVVSPTRFHEVLSHIHKHLATNLTVKALADKCYMNPDYFSRLFLQRTGRRPLAYIHEKRIDRAKLLLSSTGHSAKEISHLIGYENPAYFHRLFHRMNGISPQEYRRITSTAMRS